MAPAARVREDRPFTDVLCCLSFCPPWSRQFFERQDQKPVSGPSLCIPSFVRFACWAQWTTRPARRWYKPAGTSRMKRWTEFFLIFSGHNGNQIKGWFRELTGMFRWWIVPLSSPRRVCCAVFAGNCFRSAWWGLDAKSLFPDSQLHFLPRSHAGCRVCRENCPYRPSSSKEMMVLSGTTIRPDVQVMRGHGVMTKLLLSERPPDRCSSGNSRWSRRGGNDQSVGPVGIQEFPVEISMDLDHRGTIFLKWIGNSFRAYGVMPNKGIFARGGIRIVYLAHIYGWWWSRGRFNIFLTDIGEKTQPAVVDAQYRNAGILDKCYGIEHGTVASEADEAPMEESSILPSLNVE